MLIRLKLIYSMQEKPIRLYDFFKQGEIIKLKKGDKIDLFGSSKNKVRFLKKGFVGIFSNKKNGSKLLAVYGKGEIFPLVLVFGKLGNKFDCIALSAGELLTVSVNELKDHVRDNQEVMMELVDKLSNLKSYYMELVNNMIVPGVRNRMVDRLLFYANRFGKKKNGSIILNLPITQLQWGNSLSMTRETVARTFGLLRKRGLIEYRKKTIIILDKAGLEKELE